MRTAPTTLRFMSSLASLCLLLGCDKDDAKTTSTPTPSAAATPSASAAAILPTASTAAPAAAAPSASAAAVPPPSCPAGLTGNGLPAYCIKLPSSYSVKQARTTPTRGSIEYETGTTTDNLMITYDSTSVGELASQVEGEMKFGHDKLEKKGDLPGGNKWFQGSHEDFARIVTLIKVQPPLTLKCSFAYQPKKPPPKEAIDACKSIIVPPT